MLFVLFINEDDPQVISERRRRGQARRRISPSQNSRLTLGIPAGGTVSPGEIILTKSVLRSKVIRVERNC